MPQHLTVSGVVLFEEHVLLIHHKRIGTWLPPGGHVEDFELPHEAVVREVFEETGVSVEVLSQSLPDTGDPDAFLLPRPLCMHAVRAVEKGIACYHVDIVYLCRPRSDNTESPIESRSEDAAAIQSKDARSQLGASSDLTRFPKLVDNEEVHDSAWISLNGLAEYRLAKNVVEVLDLAQAVVGNGSR